MNIKGHVYDKELIPKLWQAFRLGHGTYVTYVLGLVNFTLILYRLAGIDQYVEPIPFALILITILVPLGIVLGIIHIRKQIPTESKTMTHHNPYVYQIVPSSKEAMAIKATMWNFDQVKVANSFIEFQAEMNKKLWVAVNELTKKEVFTQEDMNQMDKIKENAQVLQEGAIDWKSKYGQLHGGTQTKDIHGAETSIELPENKN